MNHDVYHLILYKLQITYYYTQGDLKERILLQPRTKLAKEFVVELLSPLPLKRKNSE